MSEAISDQHPPVIGQEEFFTAWENGATVLDVRKPDEYAEKRIPGVTLIPLGELVERIAEVPEGRPLYVVCAAAGRSLRAAAYLRDQLGIDAIVLEGGTNEWAASGRPTESG